MPDTLAVAVERKGRIRPLVALLLVAPVPSLAALVALNMGDNPLGAALWAASKAWLLLFPLLWHLGNAGSVAVRRPTRLSLAFGSTTGVLIALVIVVAYLAVGRDWIDPSGTRGILAPMGLLNPWVYSGVAAYWILINSALEEYVFRWFVFGRCRSLMGDGAAVLVAAVIFVAHHWIAMSAYFNIEVTAIGCLGVFLGAVIWSTLYLKLQNIWASIVSHALADLAVFGIGGVLLFG
jgi:uncharacterized protein